MKEENWHRRQAVMLASQLPEETGNNMQGDSSKEFDSLDARELRLSHSLGHEPT
jgi:hypothetical protein